MYQRQLVRYGMGADAVSTPESVAMNTALAAARANSANYLVVFVDRNGNVTTTKTYGSRSEMLADWDANIFNQLPADIALAIYMDKVNTVDGDPQIDTTVNPLISTMSVTTTKINWKSAVPWIIGGALLVAGAIYFGKPKKTRRTRRRRSAWRRRTITTWR